MARAVITTVVVAAAVALAATAGRPIPLGVVASTSMQPTLAPGDLFVALPPGLFGGVHPGDIAVFRGPSGWTVHRVVDVAGAGLVTAGDGNALTDQADGTSPVGRSGVVGVVPHVGGRPLALPGGVVDQPVPGWLALAAVVIVAVGGHAPPRPPTPRTIGLVVGAVVLLGWTVDALAGPDPAVAAVGNAGPIPSIAVETGAGGPVAHQLLPGTTSRLRGGELLGTVPGWVPSPVRPLATELGVHGPAITSAAIAAGVSAAIAAIARRAVPEAERP